MPGFLDLLPPELRAETIQMRDQEVTVRGLKSREWGALYTRYPVLQELVEGRPFNGNSRDLILGRAALIAAGLGHLGDTAYEQAALSSLTDDEANMLVQKIIQLSNPGEVFSPLLDAGNGRAAGVGEPGKAPEARTPNS